MTAFFQIAGWTLIHFVWQGVAIAQLAALAMRLLAWRSPNARYVVACVGLVLMLATPMVTARLLFMTEDMIRLRTDTAGTGVAATPNAALGASELGRHPTRGPAAAGRVEPPLESSVAVGAADPSRPSDARSAYGLRGNVRRAAGALANTVAPAITSDRVVRGVTLAWLLGVV